VQRSFFCAALLLGDFPTSFLAQDPISFAYTKDPWGSYSFDRTSNSIKLHGILCNFILRGIFFTWKRHTVVPLIQEAYVPRPPEDA
jgi:hypothetical protein